MGFIFNSAFLVISNIFLLKSTNKKHNLIYLSIVSITLIFSIFMFMIFSTSFNYFYLLISCVLLIFLNLLSIYNINVIYKTELIYNVYLKTLNFFLNFALIFNISFNSIILSDVFTSSNQSNISIIIGLLNYVVGIYAYIQNRKNIDYIELDYKESSFFIYYLLYLLILFVYPFIFVFFITFN